MSTAFWKYPIFMSLIFAFPNSSFAQINAPIIAPGFSRDQSQEEQEKSVKQPYLRSYKFGTGFFVNNQIIVTNAHVVENCTQIYARGAVKPTQIKLQAADKESDLAILTSTLVPAQAARLRSVFLPPRGENVILLGYPEANGISGVTVLRQARVLHPPTHRSYLMLDDVAKKGNSGGPVLDLSGSVVGVVRGSLYFYQTSQSESSSAKIDETHSSLAIGLQHLREFLDKNQVIYTSDDMAAMRSNIGQIEQIAKKFVVNIYCKAE